MLSFYDVLFEKARMLLMLIVLEEEKLPEGHFTFT